MVTGGISNTIGLTLDGVVAGASISANPFGITTGPDGNLRFTEGNAQNVGKIGPATPAIGRVTLQPPLPVVGFESESPEEI